MTQKLRWIWKNPYCAIVLTSSSGTNYILNGDEDVGQFNLYRISSEIILYFTSVTSNHGPHTNLAPIGFLVRKAEGRTCKNFTPELFSCYGPRMAWYGCILKFLAATKQLYEWSRPSVRPSVTFFHYVPIIVPSWNFRNYYQWQKWCPCKRSRSEVKGQGHRGLNPI